MREVLIETDSYTAAGRAVKYLKTLGINARAEKISSGRNGCTFGIRANGDAEKICTRLKMAGISCRLVGKGR